MSINQRSVTSVSGGSEVYTLDRWVVGNYFLSNPISVAQSSDAPTGFTNSLLITNGTGESLSASDYGMVRQKIEGYNFADMAWGTASAKSIVISFWVKSSVTGNYSVGLINGAVNRANRTVFTINSANTWEQKTVTFIGDTNGTWITNNGVGLYLDIVLVAGSNQYATADIWTANSLEGVSGASASWVTSTNATFQITGVQLEAGTAATPFENRPYGMELALCQRYLTKFSGDDNSGGYAGMGAGFCATTTAACVYHALPVAMRSYPTVAQSNLRLQGPASNPVVTGINNSQMGTQSGYIVYLVASGLTTGNGTTLSSNASASGSLTFSAEL